MSKKFVTAYNRTPLSVSGVSVMKFTEPSKVKQSLSYAVDINTIYENYCKTGKLPLNGQQPIYDENFVKYDNLIEAQKLVSEASQYFVGLPSKIKNQYGNSLERFIKALNSNDQFLVDEGVLQLPVKDDTVSQSEVVDVSVANPSNDINDVDVNTAQTD